MFVKKDLRKIPRILSDAIQTPPESHVKNETNQEPMLTDLRLSRRPAEFNGSISILCNPSYSHALQHLVRLSLYDCQISSLENIGALACPNLEDMNIGRNPLNTLPEDMAAFKGSLLRFWCDDCQLNGAIPKCIFELEKLEVLRMSNNQINSINGDDIARLQNLRILCLDGNDIEEVPYQISNLSKLESLLLRKNKIKFFPEGVPGTMNKNLTLLHISSNLLITLPNSITSCTSLEYIYANGNCLQTIPTGLGISLSNLRHFNVSNNDIISLPSDFIARFGQVDKQNGECIQDMNCKIILHKNPLVERIRLDESRPNQPADEPSRDMDIS